MSVHSQACTFLWFIPVVLPMTVCFGCIGGVSMCVALQLICSQKPHFGHQNGWAGLWPDCDKLPQLHNHDWVFKYVTCRFLSLPHYGDRVQVWGRHLNSRWREDVWTDLLCHMINFWLSSEFTSPILRLGQKLTVMVQCCNTVVVVKLVFTKYRRWRASQWWSFKEL